MDEILLILLFWLFLGVCLTAIFKIGIHILNNKFLDKPFKTYSLLKFPHLLFIAMFLIWVTATVIINLNSRHQANLRVHRNKQFMLAMQTNYKIIAAEFISPYTVRVHFTVPREGLFNISYAISKDPPAGYKYYELTPIVEGSYYNLHFYPGENIIDLPAEKAVTSETSVILNVGFTIAVVNDDGKIGHFQLDGKDTGFFEGISYRAINVTCPFAKTKPLHDYPIIPCLEESKLRLSINLK